MAIINQIVREPGGRILVRCGKVEREFNNRAHLLDWLQGSVDVTTDEGLTRLLLRRWRRQNPTGDNPGLIEGKRATFDATNDSVGVS